MAPTESVINPTELLVSEETRTRRKGSSDARRVAGTKTLHDDVISGDGAAPQQPFSPSDRLLRRFLMEPRSMSAETRLTGS